MKSHKKSKAKNILTQGHAETPPLRYGLLRPCSGETPETPKSKGKNGTRFARVFSKAKAHDSQKLQGIRCSKSGFSEGGNERIFFVSLVDTR